MARYLKLGFLAPDPLESAMHSEDSERLIDELRRVKTRRTPRRARIDRVIRIIKDTEDPRVRNAAAIALADMRATKASTAILEVLERPDTRGHRGTLLYALQLLHAPVSVIVLVEIILQDSYEAREEALSLLRRTKFPRRDRTRAVKMLKTASVRGERKNAVLRAIGYLNEDVPA
jgi:HEAT repeat protein